MYSGMLPLYSLAISAVLFSSSTTFTPLMFFSCRRSGTIRYWIRYAIAIAFRVQLASGIVPRSCGPLISTGAPLTTIRVKYFFLLLNGFLSNEPKNQQAIDFVQLLPSYSMTVPTILRDGTLVKLTAKGHEYLRDTMSEALRNKPFMITKCNGHDPNDGAVLYTMYADSGNGERVLASLVASLRHTHRQGFGISMPVLSLNDPVIICTITTFRTIGPCEKIRLRIG
ncbi:unnamed protein product [Somion occarium]|uniref:Uncharacterized protein n=1 Tax=Somion occarium TaxID=3059160 RepID=A0ABP1DLF5_9APHY